MIKFQLKYRSKESFVCLIFFKNSKKIESNKLDESFSNGIKKILIDKFPHKFRVLPESYDLRS